MADAAPSSLPGAAVLRTASPVPGNPSPSQGIFPAGLMDTRVKPANTNGSKDASANDISDRASVPRQPSMAPEGGGSSDDDMAQDHTETLRKLLAEKRGVLLPGAAN